MILQLENWHLGYSQILKDCRGDEGSVWILCNADVDAMAAARILCYMLRSDGIAYKLRPCTTYSALESFLAKGDMDTVRAVILLNLGASRNLTKLIQGDTAKVYVMDCRRPFHLANVHAGQNVVLFWDQNQLEIPSDGDNLSGNENTTSEEDSSSESEDEEDSDEGEQEFRDEDDDVMAKEVPPPKKPRLEQSRDYDGGDEDDSDVEDLEDQDDPATGTRPRSSHGDLLPPSSKRQKSDDDGSVTTKEGSVAAISDQGGGGLAMALTPQELHRQRRDRLRLYYSGGSFYGVPASYVAYLLSTQVRFGELGDLLWLSCVGVTDAYVHSRLDMFGYARLAMELKTHCVRIYPNDMYHRVQNTLYAEHLLGDNQRETRETTEISLSENGRILSEEDFRFFLLCHSSLYDSMVYSNYVSTKLQLWSSKGMLRFQELLAKMGCSLEECRQPFPFMKPTLRRALREKFAMYAEVSKH
jgi:cell division control protein 45